MTSRRLVTTLRQIERRRHEITGELLPPEDDGLIPYTSPIRIALPTSDDSPTVAHERRRAVRAPAIGSDFMVPMLQALFTALAGAVLAATCAWLWHWPIKTVLVLAGLTFAGSWLWRLRLADALLWEVETLTGRDMNHDGRIGEPGRAVLVNPVEARAEVARETADTGAARERQELVAFLNRCFTAGTSEAAHGITRGSGAERAAYLRRRDALLSLGIAVWRNPERTSAGWRIAVSHERAVQLLARHTL